MFDFHSITMWLFNNVLYGYLDWIFARSVIITCRCCFSGGITSSAFRWYMWWQRFSVFARRAIWLKGSKGCQNFGTLSVFFYRRRLARSSLRPYSMAWTENESNPHRWERSYCDDEIRLAKGVTEGGIKVEVGRRKSTFNSRVLGLLLSFPPRSST